MSNNVYITRTSKFLPNDPISNDEMEEYLGMINGKPSKARVLVLRNNGIKTRYYAIDKDGNSTHNNAELTAEAVRSLTGDGLKTEDIDLLCCGTTSPDQIVPSHASMVHGALGDTSREIASFTGSCCSGINAMRYAYLSIKSGERKNAVATGSEKLSTWMKAQRFDKEIENLGALKRNPFLNFEKDFLRWMLSDGAGAALLQSEPNTNGISLRIEWIEMKSYGNELKTCMYSGAVKNEEGDLIGWNDLESSDQANNSVFALKQDVKILREHIVEYGWIFMDEVLKKQGLSLDDIHYFLPHLSSEFFKNKIYDIIIDKGMKIPYEKWFINLQKVGNVGSASAFLMIEELMNSGQLNKGEKILVMVPESARFSYAYILLTVC